MPAKGEFVSIRKTWEQYIQPTTTLTFEEAHTILVEKKILKWTATPIMVIDALKEIADEHPKSVVSS